MARIFLWHLPLVVDYIMAINPSLSYTYAPFQCEFDTPFIKKQSLSSPSESELSLSFSLANRLWQTRLCDFRARATLTL